MVLFRALGWLMLPLAAALAGCLAVTGVIDALDGHVPAIAELHHLPEAVGLVLVWMLATPRRLPDTTRRRPLPKLVRAEDDAGRDIDRERRTS